MKTGSISSLTAMAQELERQSQSKRDFVLDTKALTTEVNSAGKPTINLWNQLSGDKIGQFEANHNFRRQLSSHYKIPFEYSERILAKHPHLYEHTFGTHFVEEPARRMVRTLDGNARAFLSDRYRPLDNLALMESVLPVLMDYPNLTLQSTEFTDHRFYFKATFPKFETEIKVGDPVQLGLVVSNSEVGSGSLTVSPLIYRLVCSNGMIANEYGQRRYHVGRKAEAEDLSYELYSDDTRQLDDRAFFAKVRDTVRGVLTSNTLETLANKMRDATKLQILSRDLEAVVDVTSKMFGYSDTTGKGILMHLMAGGDLTQYGLMNAITRQSQDEDDYITATKLEADGAKIIELSKSQWSQITVAA